MMFVVFEFVCKYFDVGDLCCVVMVINEFIMCLIVIVFGVDMLIVCEVEMIDGYFDLLYMGWLIGMLSYCEGKIVCIEVWFVLFGKYWDDFEYSYFYSDLYNDILLFEKVIDLIVINFDDMLCVYVNVCGWCIFDFF